jgi:hypothetical protein
MEAAEPLAIELPGGAVLVWEPASLGEPDSSPAWRIEGELDWGRFESLRVVSVALGEESLVLAALRPTGSPGHDTDAVAAARQRAGEPVEAAQEALLSLEYDGEGSLRRLGIELWAGEGGPLRVAADASGAAEVAELDLGRRESTPLVVRVDGRHGPGAHDLVTRA